MPTKEEIIAQALGSFKTVAFPIGNTKLKLRELSHTERQALDESNYEFKDGKFAEDEKGFLVSKDPANFAERWIAACCEPALTVDEVAQFPTSLKRELLTAARKVNNIEEAKEVAKNS